MPILKPYCLRKGYGLMVLSFCWKHKSLLYLRKIIYIFLTPSMLFHIINKISKKKLNNDFLSRNWSLIQLSFNIGWAWWFTSNKLSMERKNLSDCQLSNVDIIYSDKMGWKGHLTSIKCNHEKQSQKDKLMNILQNTWLVIFKNAKVLKKKERPGNCH